MNRNNSETDKDEPTREESGRIPIDVKWDLTTAPPVFKLCEQVVKYSYFTSTSHNNNNNNGKDVKSFFTTLGAKIPTQDVKSFFTNMLRDRRTRKNRSFLKTWANDNGEKIILHIWINGATTQWELRELYDIERQTVFNHLTKLEGIGFIEKTLPVISGGKESWVFTLVIADPQASIDAKIRHDNLKKQKREKDKALKKEARRLAAVEMRRKGELKAHLEGSMIQTLVTEFLGQFENTGKPVSFGDIERRARNAGIRNFMKVAIEMEERCPSSVGYYKDGKLDPTYLPPEIKRIREARG